MPGGMPLHTYVSRSERRLEEGLREAEDNLCKLVTLTGSTKSGKTVLTNTIFPREATIWIDGGSVDHEDDFWGQILEQIGGFTDSEVGDTSGKSEGKEASIGGEISAPGFKLKSNLKSSKGGNTSSILKTGLKLTARVAALQQMRSSRSALIVDDFHYIARDMQGKIIRALKPLIFEGVPVVILAIPHRRYDALRVEREMTSRIESIQIPNWEHSELGLIADEGFPLLNVEVSVDVVENFSNEAYGSPHLMQEFCRELMRKHSVTETLEETMTIDEVPEGLFGSVAEKTGRTMFDKLSRGPRQRADRLQRPLKSGGSADIYSVVLLALANLAPGMETIEYEQLRGAIRDVLSDTLPQSHEVSRVLDKMAEIAANDEASTPVLDWEKEEQRLHITDPFFAFYLKWGDVSAEG